MKPLFITVLIVTLLLTACGIGNSPSGGYGCWDGEDRFLCMEIKADRDEVKAGEVLPISITVTSKYDETDLFLSLETPGNPEFLGRIQFPEELVVREQFSKDWKFSIKANQTLVFNGTVDFTGEETGFSIVAILGQPNKAAFVYSEFQVYFTDEGGRVYYSGTQIPITPELIIEETVIGYTYTPGPFPTWAASATWYPEIATKEALTQQAARTPEPEQTQKP